MRNERVLDGVRNRMADGFAARGGAAVKAVVFAYNNIGCTGIEALARAGWEIAAVFTHADDPCENVYFRSAAATAARLGVSVYAPDDPNAPETVAMVRGMRPDAIFSFYYRKLLSRELLAVPALGGFNLHGSLLPAYRGRCPVNWALLNGELETGVTLHRMTERPDAGAIVAQRAVPISDDDTAFTLQAKCTAAAAALLDATLPDFVAAVAAAVPQDESRASAFGGRRPEDGRIDWTKSAAQIRNLVRAVTWPFPGAFSHFASRRVLIWDATAVEWPQAAPGEVVSADPLVIACGTGALRVDLAQADGGVCVCGAQFAADAGAAVGSRFGDAGPEKSRGGQSKPVEPARCGAPRRDACGCRT